MSVDIEAQELPREVKDLINDLQIDANHVNEQAEESLKKVGDLHDYVRHECESFSRFCELREMLQSNRAEQRKDELDSCDTESERKELHEEHGQDGSDGLSQSDEVVYDYAESFNNALEDFESELAKAYKAINRAMSRFQTHSERAQGGYAAAPTLASFDKSE